MQRSSCQKQQSCEAPHPVSCCCGGTVNVHLHDFNSSQSPPHDAYDAFKVATVEIPQNHADYLAVQALMGFVAPSTKNTTALKQHFHYIAYPVHQAAPPMYNNRNGVSCGIMTSSIVPPGQPCFKFGSVEPMHTFDCCPDSDTLAALQSRHLVQCYAFEPGESYSDCGAAHPGRIMDADHHQKGDSFDEVESGSEHEAVSGFYRSKNGILHPAAKKRKGNHPKIKTAYLREWFTVNSKHPYPTDCQKKLFCTELNMDVKQVNNWFINARWRVRTPKTEESL